MEQLKRGYQQQNRDLSGSGCAARRAWLTGTGLLLIFVLMLVPRSNAGGMSPAQGIPPGDQLNGDQTYYYVGPDGDDSHNGTTPERPLATFKAAVPKLEAGNTLIILDGTYSTAEGNNFYADCSDNAQNGTSDNRITVRAENERQAYIKGNGAVTPFQIKNCSYWDVSSLRLSSADYEDGASQIFNIQESGHIRVRRLLLNHANRWENSAALGIYRSHHILVEESEAYYFHRHGMSAYQSDHITFRRNFVHARNATDLQEHGPGPSRGSQSHGCCRKGGDEGYSLYFTSNSIIENCVSVQSEQVSIIAGITTVLNNPGGQNNQLLGNISYKDLRPGFLQSRKFDDPSRPFTGPAKNIVIKDFLVVGGQEIDKGAHFAPTVAKNLTMDGVTWYRTGQSPVINADPATRELNDRAFLGCGRPEVNGCDYDLRNILMFDNETSDLIHAPLGDQLHFRMEYSNSWPDKLAEEPLDDSEGQFRHSLHKEPTQMGLNQGECIVFVPEGSNMSGAGKDGADIGANILYRYQNGKLTSDPLWDPQTGAFPHGAVIHGSANDPESHTITAASINKHLNVNANGCQLPYQE